MKIQLKVSGKKSKAESRKCGGSSDDELDQAQGDLTTLSGIIQRRYGESKEAVDTKLKDYFSTAWTDVKQGIARGAEKAKDAVAEATESSKQKL